MGLIDCVKPGQRILADRGFTCRDLFVRKKAFLTIPSFLMGGRFSAMEAVSTRLIASARIHVENAIGRLKNFKLLKAVHHSRINKLILDDMVIIGCALCNL